jgi:hypothetical protein
MRCIFGCPAHDGLRVGTAAGRRRTDRAVNGDTVIERVHSFASSVCFFESQSEVLQDCNIVCFGISSSVRVIQLNSVQFLCPHGLITLMVHHLIMNRSIICPCYQSRAVRALRRHLKLITNQYKYTISLQSDQAGPVSVAASAIPARAARQAGRATASVVILKLQARNCTF